MEHPPTRSDEGDLRGNMRADMDELDLMEEFLLASPGLDFPEFLHPGGAALSSFSPLFDLGSTITPGRKLAMDLGLLLRRGKKAGKALGGLSSTRSSSFSCRALDQALAVHEPSCSRREVEFSRSNTPFSAAAKGCHHRGGEDPGYYYSYDAADIAKVFEMLNEGGHPFDDDARAMAPASTAHSPALWNSSASGAGPSPGTRRLCVADSPFSAPGNETPG